MTRKKHRNKSTVPNDHHRINQIKNESDITEESPLTSEESANIPENSHENEDRKPVQVEDTKNGGSCDEDVVDILMNGLVKKKTLEKGLGRETRPHHGDQVVISFKGWLEDGTLVEEADEFSLILGDGDVIHAFDLALPLTDLQESFELNVNSRFAYGSLGREPDIPGDADLRYVIKLLSVSDPPCYSEMSSDERLKASDRKRERGNYYFRRDEYTFAVNSYNKALHILSQNEGKTTDKIDELEVKLFNNLAVTQLKLQAYDAAIQSCDSVLQKDPNNVKALFRKGKALLDQGDTTQAIPLFKRVLALIPNSPNVLAELQRARELEMRERERWSKAANRLFQCGDGQQKPAKRGLLRSKRTWFVLVLSVLVLLAAVGVALWQHSLWRSAVAA